MEQYYEEFNPKGIELSSMRDMSEILFNDNNRIKIVLMLYDGCIGYIKKSIEFMNIGDTVNKNVYADKAKKIITELEKSLNRDGSNKISEDLKLLYSFLNNYLSRAALNNDFDAFNDVINMLGTLRESWDHIGSSLSKNNN